MQAGPIDAEWLLKSMSEHRFELFVDQSSEASETVRRTGVPVFVALKRSVIGTDGSRDSSDALQARQALRSHEEEPFDAILYGSDVSVDYAWFEPALRAVPRGVGLGAGPAHDLRTVWQDRQQFTRLGRRSWSQTGLLASADFLLSDVPAAAFDLRNGELLPPHYALREDLPEPGTPSAESRWIAVVATSLGGRDLEGLMPRVVDLWPPAEGITYVVITRTPTAVGRDAAVLVLADCTESLRRQIVIVPTGDDGAAAEFLHAADVVAVASMAELSIPGVADAARANGWVLLDQAPSSSDAAVAFSGPPPIVRRAGEIQVLSWQDPPQRLADALELLAEEIDPDDFLLLHAAGRAGPAVGLFEMDDLGRTDVVVWGQSDHVLGTPDPNRLYPLAFAVRGALAGAVARAVPEAESIWDLVCWLVSPEWIDRLRLLVMPAKAGTECWEIRDVDHIHAVCTLRCGLLPAPRWLPASAAEAPPASPVEPVVLPRRRFVPQPPEAPRTSLAGWLRRTTWWYRLRAALPWRWGLLERAMKHQW